jgi:hypothetical protein
MIRVPMAARKGYDAFDGPSCSRRRHRRRRRQDEPVALLTKAEMVAADAKAAAIIPLSRRVASENLSAIRS